MLIQRISYFLHFFSILARKNSGLTLKFVSSAQLLLVDDDINVAINSFSRILRVSVVMQSEDQNMVQNAEARILGLQVTTLVS